ncbi:GlmU family protein [Hymenobacter psychrotolerans]|uniref:UDP-N-acetylglucosamine diphosphorylase/glucosamine-1-phosphate N-acetyltransferase n=1 Tax=Hymenobacter psychrotolerans DSM 18569 TaxID=1121959 RepID=A0A1M6RW91_9BACT|nr:GlmU family protein [Hymenobacter psychrotolerans]SHK36795.1 UDP-N-acetylglucosamine diphosphorylase/glucosamine-1-phosphate N-acetyltransferase [Hymenobacter psychrotolerans DSM 18569]
MHVLLFDDPAIRPHLLPFTFTRPVAALRCGILTIAEKWQHRLSQTVGYLTEPYLQAKFPAGSTQGPALVINGAVCPDDVLVRQVQALQAGEALFCDQTLVAAHLADATQVAELIQEGFQKTRDVVEPVTVIREVWHLFLRNGAEIRRDFDLLTKGRQSEPVGDAHTIVYAPENVFIEPGVKIRAAILNAENGPIYLGKNSQVHEGAIISGPLALCEGSHINAGAKMRGDNTVGPFSKVGGEVGNSILLGYSNKGHDGYLGNSVIGEWCNLGADTNTSNLKNNYAPVKIWSHSAGRFVNTGQTFCGLMMGDHSKCGINTMFNTGTVVGVGANIFGAGFPRTFIPSFSWGGAAGFETFKLPKVKEVAERVMARRQLTYDQTEQGIMQHVYEATAKDRVWEKVAHAAPEAGVEL